MESQITISALLGTVAPFIAAIVTRSNWTSQRKRLITLALYVGMTIGVILANHFPDVWQATATILAMIAGASQIVYTALKPTGLLDLLEYATSPNKDAEI